eukprot:15362047-Ditylum_brightwellii.AAC.1
MGLSVKAADAFIINNYIDGVDPNNNQTTTKYGPTNSITISQTSIKDLPTQPQATSLTISPQPPAKADSPPPTQQSPSYADSLTNSTNQLFTATSHSNGRITVGGFTRQLKL